MENSIVRYEMNIQITPNSINKINDQFSLVDILLCYADKNRNKSKISECAIEKSLYSLCYCPIIGERIIKDDGTEDFGTHGGKIIVDSNGVKFEQTTKAYGVITKEAVENAKWVFITEKDGHTKHKYLQLKGCVVWTERFKETKELLEKDYPQSMEINIRKSNYDDDGFLVIEDFVYTGACILGSDVEPCFESARIGRHYQIEDFRKEVDEILNIYNKYQKSDTNKSEKEEIQMDKSKVIAKLSEYTYQNVLGETVAKYVLVDITDTSIGVIDREDNKVYSFSCAEVENEIVIDENSKKECIFTFKECDNADEKCFDYGAEVATIADNAGKAIEMSVAKSFSEEYTGKINEIAGKFADLTTEFDKVSAELEKYKKAEQEQLETEKRNQIDNLLNEYSKKIGKMSEFLIYRARKDLYEKNVEDIQRDLTIMAGKAMMTKDKGQGVDYNPTVSAVAFSLGNSKVNKYAQEEDRYGDLFAKVMNK